MTNQDYKKFREAVKKANEKDPIWWMGYLWINLTKRQAKDIITVLENKPYIKDTITINNQPALEIPSGLAIWKNQEV